MHCGTQLGVVHEGGAAYTERLDQLDQRTSEIEERVDQLDRQQKIVQLDQEWEREQAEYWVKDKHGNAHPPSAAGAVFMCIFAIGGAIAFVSFAVLSGAPRSGVVFTLVGGLIFGLVGVITGIVQLGKVGRHQEAKRRYRQRREQLLKRD
ncbi:hypothetical protein C5Y93_14180 [Blastopirellula marina]|uniref:Uncharacterized protein n=2 Tax=Blastopirellula marina TaxID=124 RepID=A0A2S8GNH8_9BACT|nr:hypothetical protein C5Y93_14180 [Blastopirellula marina]